MASVRLLRRFLGLLGLVVVMLPSPVQVLAQQPLLLQQNVTAQYGESLTFSVAASTPLVLNSAELMIHVLNRASPIMVPVTIVPGTDIVASATVSVTSLNLPPAAQIDYQWTFQDESGHSLQGEVSSYRYADTSVPWEWKGSSQENLTVFIADTDQTFQDTVLTLAIEARRASWHSLTSAQEAPVTIYVYPSLASLAASLRAHHIMVQDWVAAYAIQDQGIIFAASTPGPDMFDNLRRDISHEIMHLAIYGTAGEHNDSVPGWFTEGMALSTSPATDTALLDVLEAAIQNRVLLSTQALCISNFTRLDPHDAALAYAQSASLVSYIAERYGPSQISALMTAYSNGLGCSESVELALGITLSDLEQQWLRSLSTTSARTSSQDASLITWGSVWLISAVISLLFLASQPPVEVDHPILTTQPSLPRIPLNDNES